MTDLFDVAVDFVLKHEGGLVNDPNDPGGVTKYGISQHAFPNRDIKALSRASAKEIYFAHYWTKIKAGDMPPSIAIIAFDAAVQHGRTTAATMLQYAVAATPDGIIGPKTLSAIKAATTAHTLQEFAARRMNHYGNLPEFPHDGLGWSHRLMGCYSLAYRWLAAKGNKS